jgi:hypothetical protein
LAPCVACIIFAALSACSVINDPDEFIISDDPATGVGMSLPDRLPNDCRLAGYGGRCSGAVPQSCSPTGEWVDAGESCALGCHDGVCDECSAAQGVCADTEGLRRQCVEGRWVNSAPCGLTTPYCLNGACLACAASQRTCIENVPQSCGVDGQWQAESACPGGQSCVPETGECKACEREEVRSCTGVLGNCARGIKTCQEDGSWSACSILAQPDDSCDVVGDDANCDGRPNSPRTACAQRCTEGLACGPLDPKGICKQGVSACVDGSLIACEGAVWPQARDCRSTADNDCNGIPDNEDDTCRACDATNPEPVACPGAAALGICRLPTRRCLTTAGGTRSYWEECRGGVQPSTADCSSDADNDCDGVADDEEASCTCTAGETVPCSVSSCGGLRRCLVSPNRDATFWGECELASAWTFVAPEPLTGLDIEGDLWGPALFDEGRGLSFSAGDPEHIFVARRSDGAVFDGASLLATLTGGQTDGTPFVSVSGQHLYFDSRRGDAAGRDLFRAAGALGQWTNPAPLARLNSFADDQNPWVSPDERFVVFDSNRRGGAPDLWAAAGDGVDFGVPFALDELNSTASDEGAALTRDGLTVFFASNRDGGEGGLDIWMATRESSSEAFSAPQHLGPAINGPDDELDLALAPDGQELFFASSRGGASYRLFRARRGCEPLVGDGAD